MRPFSFTDKTIYPTSTGIYSITFLNSKSKKVYIGSASSMRRGGGFKSRWINHISDLNLKKHDSKKLQNACRKYGIDNMIFSVMLECPPEQCLIEEQKFIDQYDSFNNGYNSRPVANNQLGFRHSDETKCKIKKYHEERNQDLIKEYEDKVLELYSQNVPIREMRKLLPIKRKLITTILKNNMVVIKNKADYVRIPVYQYDSNGQFVQKWGSAYECANNTNLSERDIRRSIKNISITKGYIFYKEFKEADIIQKEIEESYKNMSIKRRESAKRICTQEKREFMSKINIGNNNRGRIKNIGQYDPSGNLLKIWIDTVEIIKHFNMKNSSPVLRVLRGERSLFRGFAWKLID